MLVRPTVCPTGLGGVRQGRRDTTLVVIARFLHGFALLLLLHVLVVRVLMLLMSCCHVVVAVRQTANCLMKALAQIPLGCFLASISGAKTNATWLILPVVICLSHGLDSKRVTKQHAKKRSLIDPASCHLLVSWAELFQKTR